MLTHREIQEHVSSFVGKTITEAIAHDILGTAHIELRFSDGTNIWINPWGNIDGTVDFTFTHGTFTRKKAPETGCAYPSPFGDRCGSCDGCYTFRNS